MNLNTDPSADNARSVSIANFELNLLNNVCPAEKYFCRRDSIKAWVILDTFEQFKMAATVRKNIKIIIKIYDYPSKKFQNYGYITL